MFIDMINNHKETISIKHATEIAQVSRRTIYNWLKNNKVDYTRTAGGSIRIIRDTLFKLNDNG